MPSTAPTLTWQMTKLRHPTNPAVAQDVINAIGLAIGDSTTWEVKSSAAGELEIGPVAGSATPNIRLLIASGINAAQRQKPHNATAVNANELWIGIAPDGGTLGDAHGSGDPYGVARWSLYWRFTDDIATTDISSVFVVTADEVCTIWMHRGATDTMFGCGGGALFDPPDDSDGEGTPGRVFGLFTGGRNIIGLNLWNGSNDILNSTTIGTGVAMGCFRPALTTRWCLLERSTSAGASQPKAKTESGTVMGVPVLVWQDGQTTLGTPGGTNPTNAVGILRQIRKTSDSVCREMVVDSTHSPKSYLIGGKMNTVGDAISFDNG